MAPLLINPDRMQADFDALSEIGATGDGGVNRPALSQAHLQAREWFLQRAARDGFETRVDGAGNHSAVLRQPGASRTLLLGSHLDSVPFGGRFDGALGVVAALAALRAVRESGLTLPVHLEAIDFTDEEGTLVGLLGSTGLAGTLRREALRNPRGGREALQAGLARAGLTEEGLFGARRDAAALAGYLELHIEQGPRLAQQGIKVGVVTRIVGARSFRLAFRGQANHAGTTPMESRSDAALGASALTLAAREIVMRDYPECVANVGRIELRPGGFNVIPGQAIVSLEFRAPDKSRLKALRDALLARAQAEAERFGLTVEAELLNAWNPTELDAEVQAAFARAAGALGLSHVRLHSGAGHDAESLAHVTRAGMIFIPSPNGISHDPREFSEWGDCVDGANVLLNAALNLTTRK